LPVSRWGDILVHWDVTIGLQCTILRLRGYNYAKIKDAIHNV